MSIIGKGHPFHIRAPELDTLWTIHPFLFTLLVDPNTALQIDWEHDSYQFVKYTEITKLETVPNLIETIRRVHLPLPAHEACLKFQTDTVSGASQFGIYSLHALKEACAAARLGIDYLDANNVSSLYAPLINVADQFVLARPSMSVAIKTATGRALFKCTGMNAIKTVSEWKKMFLASVDDEISTLLKERELLDTYVSGVLIENSRKSNGESGHVVVLTFSASSIVISALKHLCMVLSAQHGSLHVIASESVSKVEKGNACKSTNLLFLPL